MPHSDARQSPLGASIECPVARTPHELRESCGKDHRRLEVNPTIGHTPFLCQGTIIGPGVTMGRKVPP